MIKIERKETEKTKQAIADLQKASENESSYNIESVNQALKDIKEDGTFDELVATYIEQN